jgi:hypothetical protein
MIVPGLAISDLVFVPAVGFRPSIGAKLVTPVTAERGEWSVSIDRFVAGPERSELVYALTGPAPELVGNEPPPRPSWMYDPVILQTPDGRVIESTPEGDRGGGHTHSVSPGLKQQTIRRTVTFGPIGPGTEGVVVVIGGEPGEWPIALELTAIHERALAARRLDSSDAHHGVVLSARAIAVGDSMTAIDVYTALDPTSHPRFMRSLGTKERRPGDEPAFVLSDDAGNEVGEFALFWDSVTDGRELHQVIVFPALSANSKTAVLTIPDVRLSEVTGAPVTLPVPSESDIELGRYPLHARVSRATNFRGTAVRVQLDDGGWHDGRRVVYAESVRVDGVLRGVGWQKHPEPGDPVDSEDPSGAAREVTLESPVVQLHGPWRLELSLV